MVLSFVQVALPLAGSVSKFCGSVVGSVVMPTFGGIAPPRSLAELPTARIRTAAMRDEMLVFTCRTLSYTARCLCASVIVRCAGK